MKQIKSNEKVCEELKTAYSRLKEITQKRKKAIEECKKKVEEFYRIKK